MVFLPLSSLSPPAAFTQRLWLARTPPRLLRRAKSSNPFPSPRMVPRRLAHTVTLYSREDRGTSPRWAFLDVWRAERELRRTLLPRHWVILAEEIGTYGGLCRRFSRLEAGLRYLRSVLGCAARIAGTSLERF